MDNHLIRIFQMQIWTQCKFAGIALDDFRTQLADAEAARERAQPQYSILGTLDHEEMKARATEIAMEWPLRTWYPIQSFLTATANISKALWGQSGKFEKERKPLRLSLGVRDSSPIRSTSMRNNFDHFDERLDEWWGESTGHNYVDLSFGDVGAQVVGGGVGTKDRFRSYNPATGDLVFWGRTYNLPAMETELTRLMGVAITEASK